MGWGNKYLHYRIGNETIYLQIGKSNMYEPMERNLLFVLVY